MIYVVARIIALPDKIEELKAILTNLVPITPTEKGCISYELLQNQEDQTDFTFVETWATEGDLETHLASPHIQNAIPFGIASLTHLLRD